MMAEFEQEHVRNEIHEGLLVINKCRVGNHSCIIHRMNKDDQLKLINKNYELK